MIPKIIHYCWFGGNHLPLLATECIESWKKVCPDFEICLWNEENFDLNANDYVKEAYANKKWAFVTDYVRLYVLYKFGGVYMDTDVELLKSLDPFLIEKGFSGFENEHSVPTGIMASEKGNGFLKKLLEDYRDRHFVKEDGSLDMTTNTKAITDLATTFGLVLNNSKQTIDDFTFYPNDYFCPKDSRTLKVHMTANTVAIHHFNGSWGDSKGKKFKDFLKKILGEKLCLWISKKRTTRKMNKK